MAVAKALADIRGFYQSHRGSYGARYITFRVHPDDLVLFGLIEEMRDFGTLRIRIDAVDNDWVPPRQRHKKSAPDSTVWELEGSLETLEEQVKRRALVVAARFLDHGTDDERMRALRLIASLRTKEAPVVDEKAKSLETEFKELLAEVRGG